MGYQNFFATRLATDIGAADATIDLETPPTETSGRLVLEARNPTQREIIKYTGVSGTEITGVTRGEGGTTAKTHTKNALVEMNVTGEDLQDILDAFDSFAASAGNGWILSVDEPNTVVYNGNRVYTCTFTGIDVTDTLSPGMRIRTTRTVAAPTRCTNLESGSSQYYSKSSPSGVTFTDDFVVSAWVKLESYTGTSQIIASRYNGTSGWALYLTATGQIKLEGYNAGAANFSSVVSYQSLPLNKWIHIAAQLDMSTFTATTTTSYVMIDGLDVAAAVARGGTNPTALIQAGNLEIGGWNGGLLPFDGKLAQVAIYSAKVTQANVLATISQGLSGTETSLISAYSFNNSINDLNANANNLTAQNSAVATDTDSPFGGQAGGSISSTLDYAEIISASFSTDTTLVVRVPEGNTIPTTGGVAELSYSTQVYPYGCPYLSNVIGHAQITLAQTFAGTTSDVDISALAVTVNVPSGRKVRLTWFGSTYQATGAIGAFYGVVKIKEGSTQVTGTNVVPSVANYPTGFVASCIINPTAGSHTYKASVTNSAANGANHTVGAGVIDPGYLVAELL